MKKKIALLLMLAMTTSLLAACKKDIPTEEPKQPTEDTKDTEDTPKSEGEPTALVPEEGAELIYWTADTAFGEAAAKGFEAKTGIKVTVEEYGLDSMQKMELDGPAGTGADVFMATHDTFEVGYSSGLFLELESATYNNVKEAANENAFKTVERDGKIYGVPVAVETSAMLYNKDLVETPATTFEEIKEKSKEFTDAANNKFYFLTFPSSGYGMYAMMGALGFDLFGADGLDDENPGFASEGFEAGLQFIADLKEMIPAKSEDLSTNNGQFLDQCFIDGNVAYYPNGPWAIKSMRDAGVNLGIAPLPSINGQPMTPFAGIQVAHVSAFSDYPIAAQMFAEYLVSTEAAEMLYESVMKITARKDATSIKGLCDDEDLKVFATQFETAVPMPAAKRMSYFWTISSNVYPAVFDGTITPAEGAAKAQADFEALVASE